MQSFHVSHMTLCEAVASRDVVHVVALPTPPRLLSTALTMMLLRMSARKASYQALRMTSSRNVSAAPAGEVGAWECYLRECWHSLMISKQIDKEACHFISTRYWSACWTFNREIQRHD